MFTYGKDKRIFPLLKKSVIEHEYMDIAHHLTLLRRACLQQLLNIFQQQKHRINVQIIDEFRSVRLKLMQAVSLSRHV